jgi:hypothetical protein
MYHSILRMVFMKIKFYINHYYPNPFYYMWQFINNRKERQLHLFINVDEGMEWHLIFDYNWR